MLIRSLDRLDLDRAWIRVLAWVRRAVMDVPDRLPFEAADRLWSGSPVLDHDHAVQPVQLVFATKTGGSTVRPFVRVHPRDLLLYQALVDSLRDAVEGTLGSPEEVFAYRLAPLTADSATEGSPTFRDYNRAVRTHADEHPMDYIVQADVSSFFISIRAEELERRLLERGASGPVVRDLRALLAGWHAEGVQGLPQGLLPSSVLANFYLAPVDRALRERGARFWRYMDDVAVAADGFHAGREVLDLLEGELYADGLSLGASKTKVVRAASAGSEFRTMRERLNEQFEEFVDALGDYAPADEEAGELRQEQVRELFDDAIQSLRRDEFRRGELTIAFQELGRFEDGHALPQLPYVLLRLPGMTKAASSYMADVSGPTNRGALVAALEAIVLQDRFHRAQEWLHILRAVMVAGDQVTPTLVPKLEQLAEGHEHALVRCRALLAWGRQSAAHEFGAADGFVQRERRDRLGYALVAIQCKATDPRNSRYERWSSEGRGLANLATSLRRQMLAWNSI